MEKMEMLVLLVEMVVHQVIVPLMDTKVMEAQEVEVAKEVKSYFYIIN